VLNFSLINAMLIQQVRLENFRVHEKQQFDFSPEANLIVGANTSGKTSILEAIFLLASGTSPRVGIDREMVREGAPFASVVGYVGDRVLEAQLIAREGSPTLTTKRFKVNGVGKRMGDFAAEFHAVLFSPEDLDLVTGSPDRRRRFVDFALGSVDLRYRRTLSEYEKVRRRRNKLLEEINQGRRSGGDLGFWDAKLLEFGVFVQDERKKFFDEINPLLATHRFSLNYHPSGLTVERLQDFRPREIAAETTLIGPHRDDFGFAAAQQPAVSSRQSVVDGWKDLAKFGSRSEQRRGVLALKKAELEFTEKKSGERPVLLLDDIFSELDEENCGSVAGSFVDFGQTIITAADVRHVPDGLRKGSAEISL
jgi:DNA replication and repair protein RecF